MICKKCTAFRRQFNNKLNMVNERVPILPPHYPGVQRLAVQNRKSRRHAGQRRRRCRSLRLLARRPSSVRQEAVCRCFRYMTGSPRRSRRSRTMRIRPSWPIPTGSTSPATLPPPGEWRRIGALSCRTRPASSLSRRFLRRSSRS